MVSLSGKHIFVVEDNSENRIITRLALAETGVHIEFDMWGRDTIVKLRKLAPIDLIILDLMLPRGLSGYDVYDEIRKFREFGDVPIIAVSAADSSAAMKKCQEKGFNGFIAKPIDPMLFPEQVAAAMNNEPVWYEGYE